LFFCLCLIVPSLNAQQLPKTKLLVLPFALNTEKDLSYLQKDIPVLLREQLIEFGFEVLSQRDTYELLRTENIRMLDLNTVKDLAILADVDYAVYGSMNQIKESISLDVRLVKPYLPKATKALFVSKQGLINVQPAIAELATKIKKSVLEQQEIVAIEVQGNQILGKDAVLMRMTTQAGDQYDPQQIDNDIKKLYNTGYFDDVKVYVKNVKEGKKIILQVQEKPHIQIVEVHGAQEIDTDDILEAMNTKSGSVLNPKIMQEDLQKIKDMYRKKGYYNIQVSYHQEPVSEKQAKLVIDIKEGEKLYIQHIEIKGADKLDPDDLKDQLALSERGLFSWITGGGVLKEELLDRDAAMLEAYYANRGFMDVRVAQPEVTFQQEGISITFHVVEGERYKVGSVTLKGDFIVDQDKLFQQTEMDNLAKDKSFFDRSVLRNDMQSLIDYYSNYGYAFADVDVDLQQDREQKLIHVIYTIYKEHKVFIGRVLVTGNQKTRDNIIRRQVLLSGGDQFSGARLTRSKQKLNKLDYFESVEIETIPTAKENKMDLKVKVKEKSTGSFSAGAGYSSVENMFFTGQIQERNFLGKGYSLSFVGSFSSETTLFQVSFWNPHLYDSPLGLGFDAYNTVREYDDYDLDTTGGKLKFAYSVGNYSRLYWNLQAEKYTVDDIDDDASQEIKDIRGENWSNSLAISLVRDTTNKRINPTQGTVNTATLEYAGGILAGDDNFIKTTYDFSYFYPLIWKFIFNWHWKIGYLFENTGDEVPDFERFYLGGINTVRGYEYRDISCEDDEGADIGGYKTFYTNVEVVFPIKEDLGLLGLFFFDAGNVWDKEETMDLDVYKSIGTGIRWESPMGPLRLEYGYPLDDLEDNNGQFEFSVGQFF
jgi:outer membrane protein insertion porin family